MYIRSQVINDEAKDIFSVKSAKARNDEFMQSNSASLERRFLGKFNFSFD
jgi:hypothetical protein